MSDSDGPHLDSLNLGNLNLDGLNHDGPEDYAGGIESVGMDPRDQRREAWACEQLEVPLKTERRRLLGDFLDLLDRDSLVPYEGDVDAFEALWNNRWPTGRREPEAFELQDEQYLCATVAAFAQEMFSFSPHERKLRFARLQKSCADCPRAEAHLADLRPGLDVELSGVRKESLPELVQLAEHVARLFVLRPAARAMMLRQLVPTASPENFTWRAAGKKLQRGYPELAALQPQWIVYLSGGVSTATTTEKARRQAVKAQPKAQGKSAGAKKKSYAWILPAIVIAITAIRIIGYTANHPSPPYSPTRDSYVVPSTRAPSSEDYRRAMDALNESVRSARNNRPGDRSPNDPYVRPPMEDPQWKLDPPPRIGAPQPAIDPQLPDRFVEPKIIVPGNPPPRIGNPSPLAPQPNFGPSIPSGPTNSGPSRGRP
ncbi:MAG: hypothetical protein K8T25_05150 [Planctomycetia bacterium]|nr:hypothetical protein [Planctomycetia bacterium]